MYTETHTRIRKHAEEGKSTHARQTEIYIYKYIVEWDVYMVERVVSRSPPSPTFFFFLLFILFFFSYFSWPFKDEVRRKK